MLEHIDDDSVDVNARPAAEIARRAIALITVARRGFLEELVNDDDEQERFSVETDRFDLYSWSRTELAESVTSAELGIMATPVGSLSEDQLEQCADALISSEPLCWCLGLVDIPPVPDFTSDETLGNLFEWSPEPWTALEPFTSKLTVRDDETLALERERRELWYWRLTIDEIDTQQSDDLPGVIRDTAREAGHLNLVETIADDFAWNGQPISALPAARTVELASIVALQLHALNWACGLGSTWESTPLYPE